MVTKVVIKFEFQNSKQRITQFGLLNQNTWRYRSVITDNEVEGLNNSDYIVCNHIVVFM